MERPKTTGRDILKHLLAEHGLSGADRLRILGGSRNLGAMVLRGERNLTLAHNRQQWLRIFWNCEETRIPNSKAPVRHLD